MICWLGDMLGQINFDRIKINLEMGKYGIFNVKEPNK